MNSAASSTGAHPELGAIISRVQSRFIRAATPTEVFEPLLDDLLEFTRSEYGFIGEVLDSPENGRRFLRIVVLTDISWNDVTRTLFEGHRQGTPIEFHNLATLFGTAITSGAPVIANDPEHDVRSGSLPGGHPDLKSFLGMPLYHGGDMVGMVGLANRAGGYDEGMVDFLQPLFASVGTIIGAVQLDAERRAAEEALRVSEERLRDTFDMAAVGIAHVAPDGRFLRVNQRLCEILGHDLDGMLRMHVHDLSLPEDLDAEVAQLQQLLSGKAKNYVIEKRYRHANRSVVWVSLTMTLVRDKVGAPSYFIAVIEEITARKQTQAALLAAQAAERANAAKTEFLSRMSHELRTPLNAVLGFAQLLQMDTSHALNEDQQAKLAHIERAGAHLLAMINDVLDLSRIESGGMPLTAETVPLQVAVAEAVVLVTNAARDAQVQIRLEPPSEHESAGTHVQADHLRLRQVLVNLLSNAIKYNRKEGNVIVRWGAAPDGENVLLHVMDTGQGLTGEQQAHLFEPFNRLGAERSGIEGSGIGLVVTQRLVQLMGGTIEVKSQPEVGSSFIVSLPASPGSGLPRTPHAAPDIAPASSIAVSRPKRTILYAEDNPMNVELVREVLRMRDDCVLLVGRTGREAIALAQREQPDLLLLDMHLGDMTGLEVMQKLAEDSVLSSIPTVALSADAMPGPIEAATRAGFRAYLTKPLNIGEFLACIDELLMRQGAS